MTRKVEPEILDVLPPEHPRAIRARKDLRRVNWLLGHRRMVCAWLRRMRQDQAVSHIIELGSSDGFFLSRVLARLKPEYRPGSVVLVDLHDVVPFEVRSAYDHLGCTLRVVEADARLWLRRSELPPERTVVLANLFLHHFPPATVSELLGAVAASSCGFLACEPRRSRLAQWISPLMFLMGVRYVAWRDGWVSIRAGFTGNELSQLWPEPDWKLSEGRAGPFSHLFATERVAVRSRRNVALRKSE